MRRSDRRTVAVNSRLACKRVRKALVALHARRVLHTYNWNVVDATIEGGPAVSVWVKFTLRGEACEILVPYSLSRPEIERFIEVRSKFAQCS